VKMCIAGVDPNSHPVISVSTGLIFNKFSGLVEAWQGFNKHSLPFTNHVSMGGNAIASVHPRPL